MIWQEKWQHQSGRKQVRCGSFKSFGVIVPSQTNILGNKSVLQKYDAKSYNSLRDALCKTRMYHDSPQYRKKNVDTVPLPTEKQGEKVCHTAVPSL